MERRRAGLRHLARRVGHRGRATATFAVGAGAVSAALAIIAFSVSRAYLTDQREQVTRERTYVDARLIRDELLAAGADPGAAVAGISAEEGGAALLRIEGQWYSSSIAVVGDDLPGAVVEAAESGRAAWQRYELRGRPHLAVALPLPAVDALYAEVVPLDQLDETLRTLGTSLVAAALATTFAGSLVGFLAAGRILRPLRKLALRAEAIAAGDAPSLDVDDPELQPLVQSLNRLVEDHARRVERDSRFVSDVSHEVRAPLAALSAAVEVMRRRRAQLPERSAHALDLLGEQVDSFQQLVLDLLEISRIDAGRADARLEPTSCETLVRLAASSVGIDVPITVEDDVPELVLLDRRRIAQAIGNLLENARLYAGGPSGLAVRRLGDRLRFEVADRGPGVPDDERERIFSRFERGEHGHRGPRGTGLGLALVAEHAALHGGHAYVEDGPDGGAIFVVEVALCEPA